MSRVNIKDCDFEEMDSGGSPIWLYKGKRFTGTLVRYEKKDQVSYEQECKDGYEEGWFRSYYSDGKTDEEYQTHNNVTVPGTYKKWDDEGKLIKQF